jgi:F0F1-type ATP synthase membrane subunit b/b'
MTANQRRPGFRLPWASETDEPAGDAAPVSDEPAATSDATTTQDTATPTAAAAGDPADAAQVTADAREDGDDPAATASAGATPAVAEAPADSTDATAAPAAADDVADAGAEPAATEPAGDDFMRELVAAMRKVADEVRETGIAELRTKADDQVRRLEADAERRRDEIRNRAEKDVAGVGEWARAEAERIKQEAESRVAARRSQLEQQLAADGSRTEADTKAVRDRVAEYERELDAYHSQLLEINDPAAFAAAAKRMPKPPALTALSPAASDAPSTAATSAEPPNGPQAPVEAATAPSNGVPQTPTSPTADVHPAEEEILAARLAQLDAVLPAQAAAEPAPMPAAAEPTTTEVVVKGLGSFGAITGFRQALSGVEGIDGVALSLGQTGEFVFRATHASGFDVRGAIARLEGEGAKIEDRPEGGLRVTLERAR